MIVQRDEALSWRSRVAAGEWRYGSRSPAGEPPCQAVVKIAGSRKSRSGAARTVAYVARLRRQDRESGERVRMFDETGAEVPADMLKQRLADWEMLADAENLSRRGAEAAAEGLAALTDLPERIRLRLVQAWHLVWSMRGDAQDTAETTALLEEAARGAVRELFGDAGFHVLWGVHGHHTPNPHVHVVVKAVPDWGRRLRFDRQGDMLDTMRTVFTRHARECGLNVVAERREDRRETREAVLAGTERLRENRKMVHVQRRRDLADAVPQWFLEHALAFERRRLDEAARRRRAREEAKRRREAGERITAGAVFRDGLPAQPGLVARVLRRARPSVPPDAAAIFDQIRHSFIDPVGALESWREMATEGARRDSDTGRVVYPNKALADWYMINRPLAFGEVTRRALDHPRDAALVRSLRAARPLPPRGAGGRAADPERIRSARHEAAAAARAVARERDRVQIIASLERLAQLTEDRFSHSGRAARIRAICKDVARRPLREFGSPGPAEVGGGGRADGRGAQVDTSRDRGPGRTFDR